MADDTPSDDSAKPPGRRLGAWQTLTGRGVAAFGGGGNVRLLVVQCLAAVAAALVVVFAVRATLVPAVDLALRQLPDTGSIRRGRLEWAGTNAVRLGENAWFDFVVTPAGTEPLGQVADVQFDLRPDRLRVEGVFGHLDLPWSPGLEFDLGRIPATASFGAWRVPGQALLAAGATLALLASWWVLAAVMTVPGWLAARLLGRPIPVAGVWRIASAALVTGAVVASAGLAGYATRQWQVTGLIVSQAAHLVVGWAWFAWGIVATPKGAAAAAGAAASKPAGPGRRRGRNPFAG